MSYENEELMDVISDMNRDFMTFRDKILRKYKTLKSKYKSLQHYSDSINKLYNLE
jgi:hypothetical protein